MLSDLNDDCVVGFLAWFRALPRSPATVNKERANLLAIWRFACQRGTVNRWPNVDPEPEPVREPQAWLESEMHRLFDSLAKERGLVGKIPSADFWSALVLVLWNSGERISAILGLTWANVDLANGWIRCPAETRKGGHQDRVYRIDSTTIAALKRIKKSPGMVFQWPYHAGYIWHKFGEVLQRAGLPTDAKSKFHRIRRTVASYYEAAGGNATELLGHSTRKVTVTGYLDRRICKTGQAIDRLWRLG